VETEIAIEFGLVKLKGTNILKSIDIAKAIMYTFCVPQRVNVSQINTNLIILVFCTLKCFTEHVSAEYVRFNCTVCIL